MADSTYTGVKYFIVGIVLGGIFGLEAVAFNSDGMGAPAVAFLGIQSGLVGFLAARWRATMSPLPLGMSMGMVATLIMAAATARTVFPDSVWGHAARLFISHLGIGTLAVLAICWAAALAGWHMRHHAGEDERRQMQKVATDHMNMKPKLSEWL